MRYGFRMLIALVALAIAVAFIGCAAEPDASPAIDAGSAEPQSEATQAQSEAASDDEGSQDAGQIKEAQQMLIDLGYLYGATDGVFGPMTASAMKQFQAEHGLAQTEALDDATMQALCQLTEELRDARSIQERLIDLGYMRGGADGIFGEKSQAALKQFQSIHGLEATGLPDDETREKLFADSARTLPRRLTGGSKGDAVVELQEKLIQYGFLRGEADGSYGTGTASAVTRFQKHLQAQGKAEDLGITPTGEATPVTLLALYDPDYSSYLTDIHAGDEGDEVKRVERRLASLGYMDAEPDDVLDDYAVSAANAFCAAAGIEPGAFDRGFIDALFSPEAPVAEHFVYHPIAFGDQGVAVREVQEALVYGGMSTGMPDGTYGKGLARSIGQLHDYLAEMGSPRAFLFEDSETLSVKAQQLLMDGLLNDLPGVFNATNTAMVTRVQNRLHTLYYLSGRGIDGGFGEKTLDALKDFQATNGLPVTGTADTATLNRLFSADATYKQLPYRIEVSIDRQRVYVYELQDSGEYELTQTFKCSTGLGNLTPRGIYLDGGPVNVWHHFTKFDCWARYSFEIDGDIMFHSVLYSERDTDTLRESSLYGLGQKASHGCVRLAVKSAKWIFEHCKRGNFVVVIY